MTSFPTATIATSMSLLCAIMAPAVLAFPEFVNGLFVRPGGHGKKDEDGDDDDHDDGENDD